MKTAKALVVHGYQAGVSHELAITYNDTVAATTAALHRNYSHVFVLSGYGSLHKGWGFRLEEQITALCRYGVPERKIFTQETLQLTNYRAPVDTPQEARLLGCGFVSLGWTPKEVEFHAVGVSSHARRIALVYGQFGAKCTSVVACPSPTSVLREAYELSAFAMMLIDRWGINPYQLFVRWRRYRHFEHGGQSLPNVWK